MGKEEDINVLALGYDPSVKSDNDNDRFFLHLVKYSSILVGENYCKIGGLKLMRKNSKNKDDEVINTRKNSNFNSDRYDFIELLNIM